MKALVYVIALIMPLELFAQSPDNVFQYVEVEGGITVPIGKLTNSMNAAPNIGLWVRKPQAQNSVWAYGFSINFPKRTPLQYVNADFETETKSFAGMIGLRLDKIYPAHRAKNTDLIWSSSFGYGFYFFDDVRARAEYDNLPPSKKNEDEKPIFIRPFSTIYVGQGLQLRVRNFGVQARYNYTPYALFTDIIDQNFGAHSVSLGVFYRQ